MVIIWILLGAFIGLLIASLSILAWMSGTLRLYASDPEEEPYLAVDLDKPVATIMRNKYVVFKVDPRVVVSQK